jgi:nitroreductase
MAPDWELPARDLYMDYPQRQRDEAVRTGTFGVAAMIYAARSPGLGSTPMIGFDAEAVVPGSDRSRVRPFQGSPVRSRRRRESATGHRETNQDVALMSPLSATAEDAAHYRYRRSVPCVDIG